MPDEGIELESCSVGDSNYAPYMNTGQYIQATFRNLLDYPVTITRVTCSFASEPGVAAKTYEIRVPFGIDPGGRSETVVVPFTVDLNIRSTTNHARIGVEYTTRAGGRATAVFDHPDTGFIVTLPIDPTPKSQLFISHKIPPDTRLARRLSYYLSKIGIRGYVAEDDPRYGHHMQTGKFSPEIDRSMALVVLWTKSASADPGTMSWEMDHARKRGKRLIVVKEGTVAPPADVPADLEYFDASTPVSEADLIHFVTKIHDARRRGLD